MIILGIETSCDETAVAIVKNGRHILSNVVVSQIDIFANYGGVIPEIAARSHLEAMLPVIHKAFKDANFLTKDGEDDWNKIDAIAVTHTPGLLGSLLIGTLTARTLAILHNKPLYPVHHLKSHIYATWIIDIPLLEQNSTSLNTNTTQSTPSALQPNNPPFNISLKNTDQSAPTPLFPLLALIISGGHTQIIYMPNHNQFEIIGTTRDDAVGECFDKIAKILGLPYPGGPEITKAALSGDPKKYQLPHPKVEGLDFSFSGLKTAVLREVQKTLKKPISFPSSELKNLLSKEQVADFAASFEQTVSDILIEKLKKALSEAPEKIKSVIIAGGVSANELLRNQVEPALKKIDSEIEVFFPEKKFSGDNGAMVASAAFFEIESGIKPKNPYKINILPRSDIE